jgi:hypothetical protein
MYHLGKVLEILSFDSKEIVSSDSSVQAVILMWDKNHLILDVSPAFSGKIKKGDYVLTDYSPTQVGGQAVPKQVVTKIISKKLGERIWGEFTKYFEEKNKKPSAPILPNLPEFNQGMIR